MFIIKNKQFKYILLEVCVDKNTHIDTALPVDTVSILFYSVLFSLELLHLLNLFTERHDLTQNIYQQKNNMHCMISVI